jgi:hypothetical protein
MGERKAEINFAPAVCRHPAISVAAVESVRRTGKTHRAEAEQHDGYASGDAPKWSGLSQTVEHRASEIIALNR